MRIFVRPKKIHEPRKENLITFYDVGINFDLIQLQTLKPDLHYSASLLYLLVVLKVAFSIRK